MSNSPPLVAVMTNAGPRSRPKVITTEGITEGNTSHLASSPLLEPHQRLAYRKLLLAATVREDKREHWCVAEAVEAGAELGPPTDF